MGLGRKRKYVVQLSSSQRRKLKSAFRGGKAPVLELRRMQILLLADVNGPGFTDAGIAQAVGCSPQTVFNVRRNFSNRGFNGAISRKKQDEPSHPPLLDGHGEARLIAMACGTPPDGYARWSLRLLAERMVELEIADGISYETVRRVLKKTISGRILSGNGASLPMRTRRLSPPWRTCWSSTACLTIPPSR